MYNGNDVRAVYTNHVFDVCATTMAHTAGHVIALNHGNFDRCTVITECEINVNSNVII